MKLPRVILLIIATLILGTAFESGTPLILFTLLIYATHNVEPYKRENNNEQRNRK